MTIEQLNERISQLTDLVSSASDTIENAREMIKLAEQERDRLADQREESKPKFERGSKLEPYWSIQFENAFIGGASICKRIEHGENYYDDITNFRYNNYFKTVQRAKEVADKINFLLRLERLHDIYCPDYVPDWNRGDWKYFVYYNNDYKDYRVDAVIAMEHRVGVFFATQYIAQKVCDILNKELESEK